ncbi:MAG: ATP-binding cassette domain-containing protein [Azospirillaceae bacterium]
MSGAGLVLDGLTRRFGAAVALDGLSVRIADGGIVGLVGPDGAGKSTLMRLVAGLLRPDAGRVTLDGRDCATEAEALRTAIAYMPQSRGLWTDLSVIENLRLIADLRGVPAGERSARIERMLDSTGLAPFRDRLAGRLSGGMAQKAALACALIRPPRLVLLDEPSVGVDPISRRELWALVRELAGDGVPVLWSTAYLDEAERCDRVLLLDRGRLIGDGAPGDFTGALEDRCLRLTVARDRRLSAQARAARDPALVDAVLRGGHLDLVLAEDAPAPDAAALAPDDPQARIEPRAPRFEDAFVAALAAARRPAAPASSPAPSDDGPPRAGAPRPAARERDGGEALAVDRLVKRFGDFTAVDGVSFSVGRGEIFGLIGPNGAGKSTIFKMLCGLLPPSDGAARVAGIALRDSPAAARGRIGYMAQAFSLYGRLSVRRNLDFFAGAYGLPRAEARRRRDRALAEFGLAEVAGSRAGALPPGYRQRLSLAAALMHDPEILFLDEPTSGVDPPTRREFWLRIAAMADRGVTVMVTTHFLDEADYCDRLAVIYRGRLLALETPDALKAGAATAERPEPDVEDAFVALIEESDRRAAGGRSAA